jgi:hypothetical protein
LTEIAGSVFVRSRKDELGGVREGEVSSTGIVVATVGVNAVIINCAIFSSF